MQKLLASVRDSALMLGVSVRTIHRYVALGILPHVRVGRRKMLRTADLFKFAQVGVSVETLRRVQEGIQHRSLQHER